MFTAGYLLHSSGFLLSSQCKRTPLSLDTLLYVTQFHGYPQLVSVDKVLQRLDDKDEDSDDVMDI